MAEPIQESEVNDWAEIALQNTDITDYTVKYKDSDKGEGYTTTVVFATVDGVKKSNGENTKIDLVMKVSKQFKAVGQEQMKEWFKKEAVVYNKVFPELRKFVKESRVKEVLDSVPLFFKTLNVNEREVLILGNLRTKGYIPHDRMRPMNFNHIKLVLKRYAQFHAISFAFRDQDSEEFKNLFGDYVNIYKLSSGVLGDLCQIKIKVVRDIVQRADKYLASKLDGLLQVGITKLMEETSEAISDSVITHGDCWNSNFLFKYDDGNSECPNQVAILDWQLSSLHSVANDLAYFLFAVSSTEQVSKFDDLLDFYYKNLSDAIKELGSDPQKIFPYTKFKEHWKKYSFIGWLFAESFLDSFMTDEKDAIDYDSLVDKEEVKAALSEVKPKNPELYLERILAISKYYFELTGK